MSVLREFRCEACGYTVECFVSTSHLPLTCPLCAQFHKRVVMQQVISAPGIRGATVSRP